MVSCCVSDWWDVQDGDRCKVQLNLGFESDNFIVHLYGWDFCFVVCSFFGEVLRMPFLISEIVSRKKVVCSRSSSFGVT